MTAKVIEKTENRLQKWKEKAVFRGAENRKERKKSKLLEKSRDLHRNKYKAERTKNRELRRELKLLKRKLHQDHEAVRGHSFDLDTMLLCLNIKQSGTMSWRTCRSIIVAFYIYFGIVVKVPSASTIRYWSLKCGYYDLEEKQISSDPYVLIIDESFNVGRQSLLLVLGVKLSAYNFSGSLTMQDVDVLSIEVKKSWKSTDISQEIKRLKNLGYKIAYGCSDGGNNIVKSLKDSGIDRIYDCTHAFSLLVKKNYQNMETFKLFSSQYSLLNRQNYMGQDTFICPPKLRGKCRFLNMYPIANWAEEHLNLVRRLAQKRRTDTEQRIYKKLKWLEAFSDLIGELVQLVKLLKAVFKVLKTEGLSESSIKKVNVLISASQAPFFIKKGIREWIQTNNKQLSEYENLICCSDIIESFFGKFKHEQTKNPNKGITVGCLNMVNFGKKNNRKEVKKAIEEVRIVDLEEWRNDRNLKSFNDKRQEMLKKLG